jgi:S1-C subfamily serine protease
VWEGTGVFGLACLLLVPGEIETVQTPDFSKEAQTAAVCATVRVVNPLAKIAGTGVILGRKGPAVYVLTACHVIDAGGRKLEVHTFSASSHPDPARKYRSVRVVARADDTRDLALLLVVTDDALPSLPLCPAGRVPEGMGFKALTVGCTDGKEPTCAVEEVTGKKRVRRESEFRAAFFWEVAHDQDDGRSGGPLVGKDGHLLGVCSGNSKDKSYYCHPDEVRVFLKECGFY